MKMLIAWSVVFSCFFIADVIGGSDAPKHPGEDDVSFELEDGSAFGYRDNIDHFVSVLGEPLHRDTQRHLYGGFDMVLMEFDGITVLFIAETGAVYAIWVSDPKIRTRRGIRVGDAVSSVHAVYGDRFRQTGDSRLDYEVFNQYHDVALTFLLNDGVVVEILIAATW